MSFDGIFHDWTPEDRAEKDAAISAAPRPLAAVIKNHAGDYEVYTDGASDLANTSFEFAAVNQILAWLNFPYKLRPYLDCLIGIAGSSETAEFSAVNIEVGRQIRTGKAVKDESIATWVTRQKKKFQSWQSIKQFNLIEITDGRFDARKRKNTPTVYKINIVEWAKIVVQKARAKHYWRDEKQYRRFQMRAIRQSAYEVLQAMPECGPLKLKLRTLSEEEKFDRRVHQQIAAHLKNLDFLSKLDLATEDLHLYVIRELTKAYEKKRGLTGNLITPEEQEPDVKSSVISKIKNGTLLEDAEFSEDDLIDNSPSDFRHWENGGWVESSNQMPQKDEAEILQKSVSESDSLPISENYASNLLNPLTHGQTFLPESGNVGSTKDVSSFEQSVLYSEITEVISTWTRLIVEKLPDAAPNALETGVYQFYQLDSHTPAQKKAENDLAISQDLYFLGKTDLSNLQTAYLDWVMSRITWWKHKKETAIESEKFKTFRLKLMNYLEFEDG